MRTVTEFNSSVIVVTNMITHKFLRGVLFRMRDRSADGVFHLAILALLKTRQTLIVFSRTRQGYQLLCQKRLLYEFY